IMASTRPQSREPTLHTAASAGLTADSGSGRDMPRHHSRKARTRYRLLTQQCLNSPSGNLSRAVPTHTLDRTGRHTLVALRIGRYALVGVQVGISQGGPVDLMTPGAVSQARVMRPGREVEPAIDYECDLLVDVIQHRRMPRCDCRLA